MRRRFTHALGVNWAAASDAWAWLHRPDLVGPSGATSPLAQLADARRGLYSRHPDPGGLDSALLLERKLLEQRAAAEVAYRAVLTRSRIPAAVLVSALTGVTAAALAIVAVLVDPTQHHEPARSAAINDPGSAIPARPLLVTTQEGSQVVALFAAARHDHDSARSLRDRIQFDIDRTADTPLPADDTGDAPASGAIGAMGRGSVTRSIDIPAGGAVTLALVLSRPVPWEAELLARSGHAFHLRGTTANGQLQHVLLLTGTTGLHRIAIHVPGGVDYSWQVLRRA